MEFRKALQRAYSNMNYAQFCQRLGVEEDSYSEDKWAEWLNLCRYMARFDNTSLTNILS